MTNKILPQQRLLLEVLSMSGDIAVRVAQDDETILWRTMRECEKRRWLTLHEINDHYFKASVTAVGRRAWEANP